MLTIAVHQPNYLPWLGYFYKISQADVFVFLDDVDFQHGNSSSLTNRTKINLSGQPAWITVPVSRTRPTSLIRDIRISNHLPWQKKQLNTLYHAYLHTPHYKDVISDLQEWILTPFSNLADLNMFLIKKICQTLKISTEFVLSSSFPSGGSRKDEKIALICRELGGTHYLSGSGARKYNRPEVFRQYHIDLIYTEFSHPHYEQQTPGFISGLSIIDGLFQCGYPARNLIISGDGLPD